MSARQWTNDQLQKALVGSPRYLGTIVSTTVKDNTDTAAAFTIPYGALLLLIPSAAVNVAPLPDKPTATSGNSVLLATGEKFYMLLLHTENKVQAVGAASTLVFSME